MDMPRIHSNSHTVEQDTLDAIITAAGKIDFGQIIIKIQDGKIVQIDSLERRRIRSCSVERQDHPDYHI